MVIRHAYSLVRYVNLLKQIITVITAFAFTVAITEAILIPSSRSLKTIAWGSFLNIDPMKGDALNLAHIVIFFVVITTLIRFYHGNMRYLTDRYIVSLRVPRREQFLIDYPFLILQSIIFVLLGWYQHEFKVMYYLFTILFLQDATWFFLILQITKETVTKEKQNAQVVWMTSNFFTAIILLIVGNIVKSSELLVLIFGGIVALNMIIDYNTNWDLYFPVKKVGCKIFLASSFSSKLVENSPIPKIDRKYKQFIEEIIAKMKKEGFEVFCSLKEEEWGRRLEVRPGAMAERDFNRIMDSDVVFCLIMSPPSYGVHIELGWASAAGKDIILFIQRDVSSTPLLYGVEGIVGSGGIFRYYHYSETKELMQDLAKELKILKEKYMIPKTKKIDLSVLK